MFFGSYTRAIRHLPSCTRKIPLWESPHRGYNQMIFFLTLPSLCDIITIENTEDLTGMTNGKFRVNELEVDISANGAETIVPVLERV